MRFIPSRVVIGSLYHISGPTLTIKFPKKEASPFPVIS